MSNKDFKIICGVLIKYTGTDKNVVIPDGVLVINKFAFPKDITSVVIPNSVSVIKKYAFCGRTGLTSVKIGNGVKKIGDYAFSDCKNLKEVTIENGEIGKSVFSNCTGLTSVKIGNGVKKIGERAFSGCTNLKEVTIESGKIEKYAFYECTGLKTIKIGKGVKEISANSFHGCKIDKAVIGSENVGCLYAVIHTLVLEKTVKKFDMVNFRLSHVAYCEAKEKPFGWKWSDGKGYNEFLMSQVRYATVNWGVDISKV